MSFYRIDQQPNPHDGFGGKATALGYAGLLPFGAGVLAAWLTPALVRTETAWVFLDWVLIYGAVILSFMAGARWGAAVRDQRADRLVSAVIPALVGWAAVVPSSLLPVEAVPMALRYGVLAAAFVSLVAIEVIQREWGSKYMALRLKLSAGVVVAIVLIIARLV